MKTAIASQIPSQYASNGGKVNLLGVSLFVLTVVALTYSILESRKAIKQLKKDEETSKKISEIEHNLKSMMGNKYQVI